MLREVNMGLRTLPLTPHVNLPSNFGVAQNYISNHKFNKRSFNKFTVSAKSEKGDEKDESKKSNQSLFSNTHNLSHRFPRWMIRRLYKKLHHKV